MVSLQKDYAPKSFCDPAWRHLGNLQDYDHFLGLNWIWTPYTTVFHGLFSICLVLLISDLLFPHLTNELVAGPTGRVLLTSSVAFVTLLGFLVIPHTPTRDFTFWPPALWVIVFLVEIAAAYRLARLWGAARLADSFSKRSLSVPPWLVGLLVFSVSGVFLLGMNIAPAVLPDHPVIGIILSYVILTLMLAGVLMLFFRNTAITWRHLLATAWGTLVVFAAIAPLREMDISRTDDAAGMALVGLCTLVFLALLTAAVTRLHHSTARE